MVEPKPEHEPISNYFITYEVCSVKNDNASVAQMRDTREKIR